MVPPFKTKVFVPDAAAVDRMRSKFAAGENIKFAARENVGANYSLEKGTIIPAGFELPSGAAEIECTIRIEVAANAVIGEDYVLEKGSVLAAGSVLSDGTKINRKVYRDGKRLGRHALLNAPGAIYSGAELAPGSVLLISAAFEAGVPEPHEIEIVSISAPLPVGTKIPAGAVFAGDVVLHGSRKIAAGAALSEDIALDKEVALTGPLTMAGDFRLGGDMTVGGEIKMPGDTVLDRALVWAAALTVAHGTIVREGSLLRAGTVIKAGSMYEGARIASDTPLAADVVLLKDAELASGSIIASGSDIRPESLLKKDTVIASAGDKLAAGTAFPAGTVLPAGTVVPKGTVISNGSVFGQETDVFFSKRVAAGQPTVEEIVLTEEAKIPVGSGKSRIHVISEYAALLRAKEKWSNRAKNRAVRFVLGVRGDNDVLKRENEIRRDFVELVAGTIGSTAGVGKEAGIAAVTGIYSEVSATLNAGKTGFEKVMRWLRNPSVSLGRVVLGAGLFAAAVGTGGALSIALIAGGGVLGGIGRFIAVEGLWDRIHLAISGREKRAENAMAAHAFYNNGKRIGQLGSKAFEGLDNTDRGKIGAAAQSIDRSFVNYADSLARKKLWKRALAFVAAVFPFVLNSDIMHLFGGSKAGTFPHEPPTPSGGLHEHAGAAGETAANAHGAVPGGAGHATATSGAGHATAATGGVEHATATAGGSEAAHATGTAATGTAATSAAPAEAASAHAAGTAATDIYAVPNSGGIWHMARAAAEKNISGFESLPASDQNIVIDALKDKIVANPAAYGIENGELYRQGGNWAKNWVLRGADAKISPEQVGEIIPRRIADALGIGKNAIRAGFGTGIQSGARELGKIAAAKAAGAALR